MRLYITRQSSNHIQYSNGAATRNSHWLKMWWCLLLQTESKGEQCFNEPL